MFNFSMCTMCVWINVWYGDLVNVSLGMRAQWSTSNNVTVVIYTKCFLNSYSEYQTISENSPFVLPTHESKFGLTFHNCVFFSSFSPKMRVSFIVFSSNAEVVLPLTGDRCDFIQPVGES